jgi:hypothetical protein
LPVRFAIECYESVVTAASAAAYQGIKEIFHYIYLQHIKMQQQQQQQQQQSPLHIPKVDSSHFFNINEPTPTKSNRQQQTATSRQNLRKKGPSPPFDQYKQLQQKLIIFGTAFTLGFVLFLLSILSPLALIGLTILITSLGACFVVSCAAVKTRYHLELEHPLGLVRHLPPNIRTNLTEKSLHECLSPVGSYESLATLSQQHSSKDSLSSLNSVTKNSSRHRRR